MKKRKSDIQRNLFTKQIDSQTQKIKLWLPKGKRKRRINQRLMYIYIPYILSIYGIDKQQGPAVQHRELYSYLVTIYNRKESEKE